MTARRPKDIGTATETAVVRYLRDHGWPHAERRALRGTEDAGDITGTPGVCWSVKGGAYAHDPSDRQVAEWLAELDKQRIHAGAGWGVLVTRRWRAGDPERWWAWLSCDAVILIGGGPAVPRRALADVTDPVRMHLVTAVRLLRVAGYGTAVTHA